MIGGTASNDRRLDMGQAAKYMINEPADRQWHLDLLRIAAAFFVIVQHVSAQSRNMGAIGSYTWQIFNIYNNSAKWAVPIFVMISGALVLSKKQAVQKIDRKTF